MIRASARSAGFGLLWAIAGCSGPTTRESYDKARGAIELSQQNQVYALVDSLWEQRDPVARTKEAASLATGALLASLLDVDSDAGGPALASNGTQVRATCGITFLSPSYAVTAAHCASEVDLDLDHLVVEMYRPTPAISQGYLSATVLSGSFPDFSHGLMDAAQGYFVDRYPCKVVTRCGEDFGAALNCDPDVNEQGDVALLKCDNRPGDRYGFLDLASEDDPNAELFMPWKHEIYDVDLSNTTSDSFNHYVLQTSQNLGDNYHYFGLDIHGTEQNQLLPLVPINFSDGSGHIKVDTSNAYNVVTDLVGCHGTSGSGALQMGSTGFWQLLGPARYGDFELTDHLCDHIPSLDMDEHVPGARGISYAGLVGTQHVYSRNQADVAADCEPLGTGATTLFTHLAGDWAHLQADTANADFSGRLATPSAPPAWEFVRDHVMLLDAGQSTELSGFQLVSGQRYRIGLNVGCPSAPCPRVIASMQGADVLSTAPETSSTIPWPVATAVTAPVTASVTIGFRTEGGNQAEIGAVTVRADMNINTFDTAHERLEAALFDLAASPLIVQSMRFVGDAGRGFAARLLANERLLLTRQAIVPGQMWTINFNADTSVTLSCGFIDRSGQVAAQVDCNKRPAVLDDSGSIEARAAFFIESPIGNPPVTIDNVQTLSAAPNTGPAAGGGGSGGASPSAGGPADSGVGAGGIDSGATAAIGAGLTVMGGTTASSSVVTTLRSSTGGNATTGGIQSFDNVYASGGGCSCRTSVNPRAAFDARCLACLTLVANYLRQRGKKAQENF